MDSNHQNGNLHVKNSTFINIYSTNDPIVNFECEDPLTTEIIFRNVAFINIKADQ